MSVSSTKVTKNSCITHKKQEKYTFPHFFLAKILRYQKKAVILHPLSREKVSGLTHNAAIAQLVEHDLAKVGVASSSLVCRSRKEQDYVPAFFLSAARMAELVDALVSGASVERRAGSSPVSGTRSGLIKNKAQVVKLVYTLL